MTAFFNIHSHKEPSALNEVITVLSFDPSQQMTLCESGFFSAGIHPWSLPLNNLHWFIRLIEKLARHQNCVAIGECGLDYKKNINRKLQISVFKQHASIAEKYQLPLIIHCVSAFHDILQLKKELSPSSAWIIHGFAKSVDTALSCMNEGFYLSFGRKALQENFSAVIKSVPLNRIFVESDDSETDIKAVYNSVAHSKQIDCNHVKHEIARNIEQCFNKIR